MHILAVIPARGGSKGIPKKNIRLMAGKPLISYAIENAKKSKHDIRVVVTTDNAEIKSVASSYSAEIIDRPDCLADDKTTLDPVIFHAVAEAEKKFNIDFDVVITMQPTSPCLKTDTLDKAIDLFVDEDWDTIISGVNDAHLSWKCEGDKIVPNYKERLNRQYLPKEYKETGAFVITKRVFVTEKSRFGKKITIFECPAAESIDIDTPDDWCLAESHLKKKKIFIRVDGNRIIGMGHIYRGIQIAESFIEHEICFILDHTSDVGIEKIASSYYPYKVVNEENEFLSMVKDEKPNIVITDVLNTTKEYIESIKKCGSRIVSFEDCGSGTEAADATINALYEAEDHIDIKGNIFWGADYYLIRSDLLRAAPKEFSDAVREILVVFGGVDPANLTLKTVNALEELVDRKKTHVTFILGMGYEKKNEIQRVIEEKKLPFDIVTNITSMADYMGKADLAISSQGRTMLELASMGVPTILMAQNKRELTHEFGEIKNGFLNLGLGSEVTLDTLEKTIRWLIDAPQIRKSMHDQMLKKDLKHGMNRVKKIILGDDE